MLLNKDSVNKISFIIPSFDVGGSEFISIHRANYLGRNKFIPEIVYWLEGGKLKKHIKPEVSTLKIKGSSLLMLLFSLIKYFKKSLPEIVHTSNYMVSNIVLIARMFSSHKPKVIIGAESDFNSVCNASKKWEGFLLRSLSKCLYHKCDKVVAVSKGVKKDLMKELKLEESKVTVIYNGILTEKHRKEHSEIPNHHWYDLKGICLICSIGRLSPEKGIFELVCAFRKAITSNNSLRLLIVGEGNEEIRIKEYIEKHSLEKYAEVIGFRENYYSYLDNADIFVLNSFFEGMSNILAEAVTTNTKIISTDCKHGPSEILHGVSDAKLIDVNNQDQLVQAILDFSNKKKVKRKKMPNLQEFSFKESMKKYMKVIHELNNKFA